MRLIKLSVVAIIFLIATQATFAQSNCAPNCGVPVSAIEAYPEPNVFPLQIDEQLLYDRNYRTIVDSLVIHDSE